MASESSMSELDMRQALTGTAEAFALRRVNYALIGGMAISHRSQPRFTIDVDFLVNVPALSLPPLLDDFQARGFEFDLLPTIREWTQHHLIVLSYHGIRVDWLKPVLPVYQHILDRAKEEILFERTIRMASVTL